MGDFKSLISRALERGYATHDDIRECVPDCVFSEKKLAQVAELLSEVADVFETEPSDEERANGRIAILGSAFRQRCAESFPGLETEGT